MNIDLDVVKYFDVDFKIKFVFDFFQVLHIFMDKSRNLSINTGLSQPEGAPWFSIGERGGGWNYPIFNEMRARY